MTQVFVSSAHGAITTTAGKHTAALMTARDAAALCLEQLLLGATFRVYSRTGDHRSFQLRGVFSGFPGVSEGTVKTPSAWIDDIGGEEMDDVGSLETEIDWDPDDEVVALAGEVTGQFAVNLWATDMPELDALRVGIPALFRGGSEQHSVMVALDPAATPEAFQARGLGLVARLSLDELPKDTSGPLSVRGEWRARFVVGWDAESVTSAPTDTMLAIVNRGGVSTEEL